MGQQYRTAWGVIKEQGKLELTVHAKRAPAIEWGILKAKSRENASSRRMGLTTYPKLVIERKVITTELVRLSFTLAHDSRHI